MFSILRNLSLKMQGAFGEGNFLKKGPLSSSLPKNFSCFVKKQAVKAGAVLCTAVVSVL